MKPSGTELGAALWKRRSREENFTRGTRIGSLVYGARPAPAPEWDTTGCYKQCPFGSAGGGAPACPGFLNWGQPFVDLLLHPRIVPFLAEFVDSSGYGVRLDR